MTTCGIAGMGGEYRLPVERAGAAAISGTREAALGVARQGVCHITARVESWAIEVPAGWPDAALLEQARAMLAQYEAARRAAMQVESGSPVIYGVAVLIAPSALEALAADALVHPVASATRCRGPRVRHGSDRARHAGVGLHTALHVTLPPGERADSVTWSRPLSQV